jgi:hypothetical protein
LVLDLHRKQLVKALHRGVSAWPFHSFQIYWQEDRAVRLGIYSIDGCC